MKTETVSMELAHVRRQEGEIAGIVSQALEANPDGLLCTCDTAPEAKSLRFSVQSFCRRRGIRLSMELSDRTLLLHARDPIPLTVTIQPIEYEERAIDSFPSAGAGLKSSEVLAALLAAPGRGLLLRHSRPHIANCFPKAIREYCVRHGYSIATRKRGMNILVIVLAGPGIE